MLYYTCIYTYGSCVNIRGRYLENAVNTIELITPTTAEKETLLFITECNYMYYSTVTDNGMI